MGILLISRINPSFDPYLSGNFLRRFIENKICYLICLCIETFLVLVSVPNFHHSTQGICSSSESHEMTGFPVGVDSDALKRNHMTIELARNAPAR